MKMLRPMNVQTCIICHEQFNEDKMHSMNVGRRIEWMCNSCYAGGMKEIESRRTIWNARKAEQRKRAIPKSDRRK